MGHLVKLKFLITEVSIIEQTTCEQLWSTRYIPVTVPGTRCKDEYDLPLRN